LSEVYPSQQELLDDALATSLARVKNGRREDAGVALGISVADAILASRANDGSAIDPAYVPGTDPGDWQPAPPTLGGALGPGWGSVEPFAIESGAQFRPPPVPAMDSDAYTHAFDEVKSLGEKDSASRTAEQTEIGLFWAYDRPGTGTPPVLYNQIVQTIAKQKHNTTLENARLFALANLAQADAGIAAWDCKYVENFWRPITGIRAGDADGNDFTDGDADWKPLGAPGNGADIPDFTPPFPAYVSGHATFGAAVFQVLRDFYGTDDVAFTIGSDELPGVTRSFDSFSQASEENGISRIYLGIHWSFDNTAGQELGRDVAEYTFDKMLRPVKGSRRGDHPQQNGSDHRHAGRAFRSSGPSLAELIGADGGADDVLR